MILRWFGGFEDEFEGFGNDFEVIWGKIQGYFR